jgi:hypothetical protein
MSILWFNTGTQDKKAKKWELSLFGVQCWGVERPLVASMTFWRIPGKSVLWSGLVVVGQGFLELLLFTLKCLLSPACYSGLVSRSSPAPVFFFFLSPLLCSLNLIGVLFTSQEGANKSWVALIGSQHHTVRGRNTGYFKALAISSSNRDHTNFSETMIE